MEKRVKKEGKMRLEDKIGEADIRVRSGSRK